MTDYEDLAFDPAAGIDEVAELKKKLDIAVKALEKINNKNRKFFELTTFEAFFIAVKDDVGEALSKIRR